MCLWRRRAWPHPPRWPTSHRPNGGITAYARKVFGEALRQAATDPGHVIGVADLLRAALRDSTGGACRTLDALGVPVNDVLGRIA